MTGGEPTVTIFIGQAQYGEYTVRLKDPITSERKIQADGDNADDITDTFELKKKLTELDSCILSWSITIAAPATGPGQAYFARVEIRQDGNIAENGAFEYGGLLDNTQNIVAATRLRVA
jgi:hypothetical protein